MATLQELHQETSKAIALYLSQELKIAHGYHYRCTRVVNAPRVLVFTLDINPRYAKSIIGMAGELSMAARLDKNSLIRVSRGQRGTLSVEVPKPENLWRTVNVSDLPKHKGTKIVAGIDTERALVPLDISAPLTPHWLIAGQSGSGKTNCQRRVIQGLASQNDPTRVRMLLIDTEKRGKAWKQFASLPHLLHPVIIEHDEAQAALLWTVAEIDKRAREDRNKPTIAIGIDEIQGLFEIKPELVKTVDRIAATGREWGVHLIIATQNPTAQNLGTANIKRNMARLVGRVTDSTAAFVATGQHDSGAEGLTAAGDMLRVDASGITRVAVAYVTEQDMAVLPKTDNVETLDLSPYEDVDQSATRAEPIAPEQVAAAISTGRGIRWLMQEFNIGSSKAKRIKDFSDNLAEEMSRRGYSLVPLSHSTETR